MVKVAVVGTGKMGQLHMEMFAKISQVEVVGIVGRDSNKTKAISEKYKTNPFDSLENLIEQTDVEIVDICLPTFLHEEYVKLAARKGKYIICEKPLGLSVDECNAMIKECKKNKVELYVGHTLRFSPEYSNARDHFLQGAIGKPGVIQLSRKVPYPQGTETWYHDQSKSGGMVLDLGIHDLDWLRWTFGDVERVMARQVVKSDPNGSVSEVCLITLRLSSGTIAHIHLSWGSPSFECSFELTGDKGLISYNSNDTKPLNLQLFESEEEREGVVVPKHILVETPLDIQLKHFIECFEKDLQPLVTAEDALYAVEIAAAVKESIDERKPVMVHSKREVY
jgi:predicted dehydrogenase